MNFFNIPDEFKKNPELNEEDLNHLREWISKQPHLPTVTGKYLFIVSWPKIFVEIPMILYIYFSYIVIPIQ